MPVLITSNEKQQKLLKEMHECPVGGHQSVQNTYDKLKMFVTWPGMFQAVEDYVMKCEICLENIRLLLCTATRGKNRSVMHGQEMLKEQ